MSESDTRPRSALSHEGPIARLDGLNNLLRSYIELLLRGSMQVLEHLRRGSCRERRKAPRVLLEPRQRGHT